jgi:hypothetical protein
MNALLILLVICMIIYLAVHHARFYYYFFILLLPYYLVTQFIFADKKLITPKKKGFISMWTHPYDPQIYGNVKLDITKLIKLLPEYSKKVGYDIGLIEFFLKITGDMVAKFPFLNGNILVGRFLPRPTVDISLQIPIDGGRGMEIITLKSVDRMSLVDIKKYLDEAKEDIMLKKDKIHNRRMLLASIFQPLYDKIKLAYYNRL